MKELMTIRTRYTLHMLAAHLGGFAPLTLRQYVALMATIKFNSTI